MSQSRQLPAYGTPGVISGITQKLANQSLLIALLVHLIRTERQLRL